MKVRIRGEIVEVTDEQMEEFRAQREEGVPVHVAVRALGLTMPEPACSSITPQPISADYEARIRRASLLLREEHLWSDENVANMVGLELAAIRRLRRSLGIPRYDPSFSIKPVSKSKIAR